MSEEKDTLTKVVEAYEKVVSIVVREAAGAVGKALGESTRVPGAGEVGQALGREAGKAIDDYGRNHPEAFRNCNRK